MKVLAQNDLDEIIARLTQEFKPEKIILFGSHAWGNPHADSDVDLLVIVSSASSPPSRRAAKAYRCLQGLKTPTEIIVSTRQELERYRSVPSSLTRQILERGKIIYG
ncbi:nucleotidyltransferase domain-containing protein [candidate division KSB1 bacterium]|nr:nucleotidyltransferase domain-containing protein [candidate division KSB1 bacterium]